MTPRRIEFLVYLAGLILLGALQSTARAAIGQDGVALALVIAYLLVLRLLGGFLADFLGQKSDAE